MGKFKSTKVDEIFPLKTIKIFDRDKEWMTEQLQKISRQKAREYRKNSKSIRYMQLQAKFLKLKRNNCKKYIQKQIEFFRESDPRKFFKRIKKAGERIGEADSSNFTIPSFIEQNLNSKECADLIANHFSSISQEYDPINLQLLPERVKTKILSKHSDVNLPHIEPYQVYEKFAPVNLKCAQWLEIFPRN